MSGNMFFDVIWCPEGPGTSWEWFSMNLGSIIHFTIFLIFLILSGWCSGSPVGCFMWFGGCSASVLILRSRLKAIGRCSKPIRYHLPCPKPGHQKKNMNHNNTTCNAPPSAWSPSVLRILSGPPETTEPARGVEAPYFEIKRQYNEETEN